MHSHTLYTWNLEFTLKLVVVHGLNERKPQQYLEHGARAGSPLHVLHYTDEAQSRRNSIPSVVASTCIIIISIIILTIALSRI